MYTIPLFDLNFDHQEETAVLEVLRSKWISTGPRTIEFEEKFAEMLNVEYGLALSNCTVALHLALICAGVEKGDEVICPSLTFVATVNSIKYLDATPIFADVTSLSNLTISPFEIRSKISSKTKAIIVMHYGGFACDMDEIMAIAKEFNLIVIEDACHAPLSEYKSNKLGTIGHIGCFSFFSNKNISTGEGGMLVTNDKKYFDHAKLLRSHGMTSMSYERAKGHSTEYDVVESGYNYRMDDLRSAIGIVQLNKIKADLEKRANVRKRYLALLSNSEDLIVPFQEYYEFSSNYIMPIILSNSSVEKRNYIRKKLAEKGIQTSVHYPSVHLFSIYKNPNVSLPITEYASDNLLTLPMYSNLSIENVNYICSELLKLL